MKSIIFAVLALLALFSSAKAQANCDTCTFVIGIVENWVESNATESEIQTYLDTLCSLVPGYSSVCDGIVNQGLAQIILWIQQNETPTEICQQLGMCSSKKLTVSATVVPIKLNTIPTDSVDCTTCEYVMTVVETWLENANNQQDVITAIEVVCTYMPDWESTCDAIVSYGVPTVVNWVEEYENATTVCTQIEECPSSMVDCDKPIKSSDEKCGICGDVITTIENYIAQGSTEQEIENYLEIICALIPQWSTTCDSIVTSELPQIIAYLEANQTPDQVCTEINLCN